MAKKYMMDPQGFEAEQHEAQKTLRDMYVRGADGETAEFSGKSADTCSVISEGGIVVPGEAGIRPSDIPVMEIAASEVIPYFDWKMFYAIWGVRYGSAVPEAMELIQLRNDAEDELYMGNFKIRIAARFFLGGSNGNAITFKDGETEKKLPFMRQESGARLSLCDFVAPEASGARSPFGMFAVSVHTTSKTHEEGCCCPACSNRYEDLIGKTVRLTLAEAASCWLDRKIQEEMKETAVKVIKPAAGYASCPDHTLKEDILKLLGEDVHPHDCHGHHCSCNHSDKGLGISLTESYAMTPEASICGLIFMHPDARYPDIRRISREQYDEYALQRGMSEETARRFLGHLL
jgi:5-methyltetrahydrofolate--homocysteine methyltransferase